MTTELEEKFYKTFEIEPKHENCYSMADKTKICPKQNKVCYKPCEDAYWSELYPPITDHILLELVCTINSISYVNGRLIVSKDIDTLKREILLDCIVHAKDIKSDVRKLFEE